RLVLLGVLVGCGVSAFVSGSASGLEFYKCVKGAPGAGRFENSNCVKEGGSKEWELELLKELLNIRSKQTEPFVLEGKIAGITVEISCEKEKGTGSIHNGLTAKDLEASTKILTGLGEVSDSFEACTVLKPVGQACKVTQPIIIPVSVQLSANVVVFLLFSILVRVDIVLVNCKTTALNGSFPIEGMGAGVVNNTTSTLSFKNEEPNKKLIFGGNPARFVG